MEPVNLSILVVNCKQYIPSYNWYFCKSGRYFCGTANSPDDVCFNEARLKEFNDSDDYVLMPERPGMTDGEAAVVLKWWCRRNDIPYNDDMDNIEAAYRWHYKCEDETVWLTQQQLVDLFQTSKSNISEHIKHIFKEGELEENQVVRKFRTTASDVNQTY